MPEATGPPHTLLGAIGRLDPGQLVLPGMTRSELMSRAHAVADAAKAQGAVGEAVALRMPNGPDWVVAFLGLLEAGSLPLPVAPDTPDPEVGRLLELVGGGRILTYRQVSGEDILLAGTPGPRQDLEPGVLLPTSGSTGAPRLVQRSEASWLSEARRYRDGVGVTEQDIVVLPVPLSHAYALGWLCGGLLAGAALRPVPPTALGQTALELAAGATVITLVPAAARLLATRQKLRARRAGPGAPAPAPGLRIAMVGAGPVDASLDTLFTEAYGIGVARNYGSTELGAVFSGPAGLAPMCVGAPLPGVGHRLVDPTTQEPTAQGPGALQIRTDTVPDWHDTGDLAVSHEGSLRILGREGTAVRRGGRWVAPLEIEAVFRAHNAVREVRVAATRRAHEGEDGIVAEVVVATGGPDEAELRAHAARHLAPYKVPDIIVLRTALPKTATGKAAAAARYRLTPRAIEATRAYKTSELLFALHDLGALTALAEGTALAPLSADLGCDPLALGILLDTAASLGLLSTAAESEPAAPRVPLAELTAFVRLEERLSHDLVTRRALAAVARSGLANRPFERRPDDAGHAELVAAYQGAMSGPSSRARTALGLRLLRPRPGARLVEVTAGPGRYLDRLLAADPAAGGHLWQTGRLSGPVADRVDAAVAAGTVTTGPGLPSGEADLCVVANSVHDASLGALLSALLATLRPGGLLLVDDVFLPSGGPGAELALDWLTHGGTAWTTVEALTAGLAEAGADVVRHLPFEPSPCHLVIAKEAD
ncbi:AMP-binding protein [Streptomyces sp. H27-C3]|uniref:class I adenylate-forming enzyme family protein n=1 Tax=Streptomyces sp. H27-C3 TaxID=3046305 RepID=UPI0024BA0F24|nr:AMP-binding protein [Streptomyces sp. H27-C3]MDJ0462515.1 AMP-binding protein [Streptomyces sp. H27-C3]